MGGCGLRSLIRALRTRRGLIKKAVVPAGPAGATAMRYWRPSVASFGVLGADSERKALHVRRVGSAAAHVGGQSTRADWPRPPQTANLLVAESALPRGLALQRALPPAFLGAWRRSTRGAARGLSPPRRARRPTGLGCCSGRRRRSDRRRPRRRARTGRGPPCRLLGGIKRGGCVDVGGARWWTSVCSWWGTRVFPMSGGEWGKDVFARPCPYAIVSAG